jgi:SAM-dependent methyltransferase
MAAQNAFEKDWEYPASKDKDTHFSNIIKHFRDLGGTDSEPMSVIIDKMKGLDRIEAVDVGCGAGRNDMLLYRFLGNKLRLTCLDANEDTVNNLSTYLIRHGVRTFSTKNSTTKTMPFSNNSMDCMFTLDAVHHNDLGRLIREGSRILRNGGYLFIYTKIREHNEMNVWRQHLSRFNEKEKRLNSLDVFKQSIDSMSNLVIESIVFFAYTGMAALEQLFLRDKSRNNSVSSLYTPDELEETLKDFSISLRNQITDTQNVRWFDEKMMFVIKKE